MLIVLVIVVALLAIIGLLALSPLPRWTVWFVPMAWTVYVVLQWIQEVRADGESQEGLILIVGVVVLAVIGLAAALTTASTRRR